MLAAPDHFCIRLFSDAMVPRAQSSQAWNRLLNKWLLHAHGRSLERGEFPVSVRMRALPDLRYGWSAIGASHYERARNVIAQETMTSCCSSVWAASALATAWDLKQNSRLGRLMWCRPLRPAHIVIVIVDYSGRVRKWRRRGEVMGSPISLASREHLANRDFHVSLQQKSDRETRPDQSTKKFHKL